jgi:protein involved in polysaccharide export with SLBB domain
MSRIWCRLVCLLILVSFQSILGSEAWAQQKEKEGKYDEEYKLQKGDVIEVKFSYNPEFNEKVEIGPDGRISLQMVGEIVAAGLTRAGLQQEIVKRYSRILKSPDAVVIVRNYVGQKVFVGGEVNTPGLFPLDGEMTVLQALLRAGGLKNTAKKNNIVMIRKREDNSPQVMILDLKKMMSEGQQITYLRPYDVVFVPKSRIARVDQFIDQYMRQLLPISVVAGFSFVGGNFIR